MQGLRSWGICLPPSSEASFMNENAGWVHINSNFCVLLCASGNLSLKEVSCFAANVSFQGPALDEIKDSLWERRGRRDKFSA